MRLCLGLTASLFVAFGLLQAQPPHPSAPIPSTPVTNVGTKAKAILKGAGSKPMGTATFTQAPDGVHILLDVTDAKPGKHGLSIRENGTCSPPFTSAGPTLNIYNMGHGCPPDPNRELGSLGNIEIKSDGTGHFEKTVDKISVVESHHQIIGRSIIVAAGEDDCKAAPTGSSAAPVLCGVITK